MPNSMLSDAQLERYIDIWHTHHAHHHEENGHLSEERIFELSSPENLAAVGENEFEHLSNCPVCMVDWAFWVNIQNADDSDADVLYPAVLSGGMLRAAASPGAAEALRLPSFCGGFVLSILPEIDNPANAMIILDSKTSEYEARSAEVRDTTGRRILQGRFAHGRIAGICRNLQEIDPGAWSLIIH